MPEMLTGIPTAPPAHGFLVVLLLDNWRYALPLHSVVRVVRAVEVTPLPQAPDIVLGAINVGGCIIPVFNLRKRFRLPERELELDDLFVMARTSRRTVALVVDAVDGVMECAEGQSVPPDAVHPALEYVQGVVACADGMILIHDLDKFLSLPEEAALTAAMARSGAEGKP